MPADKAVLLRMVLLWPCKAAVAGRSTIPSVKSLFQPPQTSLARNQPSAKHKLPITATLWAAKQETGILSPESLHKSKSHYATF